LCESFGVRICKSKAAALFYGVTAVGVGGSAFDFTWFFVFMPPL
jgi:hypothetical protein